MRVDSETADLIQTSYHRLQKRGLGPEFVDEFYIELVLRNEQISELFRGIDWKLQEKHFLHAFQIIVESAKSPEKLTAYLEKLGKTHLSIYGITPDMLPDFKIAVIKSLRNHLQDDWTEDVEAAWEKTLDQLLKSMFD